MEGDKYMANLRPFIIALAFALIAVVLVYLYIRNIQQGAGPEEIEMARVVRATTDIPPRTTITEHMLEEIEVPADIVTMDTVTELEEILGQVSMGPIYEQQILMRQMFREETALEDLSRMLQEGQRAVTVGVTEVSGLGGNIQPGDNVDVLVSILNNDEVGVPSTFTILRNIDVMAVGQDIGFEEDEMGNTQISKSVTLRVNPSEAEILTLASEVGSLRLALRDPDDLFAPATNGTALTEFTKFTPTREDLQEMARREREAAESAASRAQPTVVYETPPDWENYEGQIVEVPPPGPPPFYVELIMGGESQMVEIPRKR
jgi:pilus assembly protein CpaB